MSGDPRLVRVLVACYPAGWRRIYGDEYAQVLCDLRIHRRPVLIVDSLRGAVRSHGGALMSRRSPIAVTVWAAGLFTVAGIGFAKLAEDFTGVAGGLYTLLVAAAAVALLALIAAAAPSVIPLLRDRDAGAWKYVFIPVVGTVIWFGVLRLMVAASAGHGVHSVPTVLGFAVVSVIGVAVVAATAWAAASLLQRVEAPQPMRLRPVALMVVAAGMAATTLAALIWGLQVHAKDPAGFRGDYGLMATPFVPSWIAVMVAMAAATAMAVAAGRRQLASMH